MDYISISSVGIDISLSIGFQLIATLSGTTMAVGKNFLTAT
jgi:hypothetical protein